MALTEQHHILALMKTQYPHKFAPEAQIFSHIHRGDHIFIATGCGEPQYLVNALIAYVESHPGAFYDTEVFQVWTLGVAPYTHEKFKRNFRHNSFFIGQHTRQSVNRGLADYTPIFLSQIPQLLARQQIPVDIALIQTSCPDHHGYVSLGVSVDITKAAVDNARLVIAQVNAQMPRVHGDSFIHLQDIDFLIPYDEPILAYHEVSEDAIAQQIGGYVAQLIEDGDTIQVGYGNIPNAILSRHYYQWRWGRRDGNRCLREVWGGPLQRSIDPQGDLFAADSYLWFDPEPN